MAVWTCLDDATGEAGSSERACQAYDRGTSRGRVGSVGRASETRRRSAQCGSILVDVGPVARLEDPRQRAAAVAQQGRRSRPRVVEEVGVRWGWHR